MSAHARILVVDDNAALADNLREILDDAGYEVRVASTARDALAASASGFDVALVDVRLPDGDGPSLTIELLARHPESAVVLLTGFAALETAIAAVRAGAFAYLVKPASTETLLITVEQALRQVRLHGEKRELSRRAQVAEKLAAVGTMTAGLSHEIRNPLNAAGLQLAVLERRVRKLDAAAQPPLLEPLALVRDEIQRLERLVRDFLLFARPSGLRLAPVPLHDALHAVASLLGAEAEKREVKLELAAEAALPAVLADRERLQQVLMNLVLNALQAAPPGGRVRISASAGGGAARIELEDSGAGISPEAREHLFEPFFTTKAAGSGLGLPISHALILQHGGSIAVDASPLGGARFTISLPLAPVN